MQVFSTLRRFFTIAMRIISCVLLPVFLALAARLCAQSTAFEKISIEQGLSQGMIFDILQTRDGFLWVATKDGLNRYDGYNFKVFSNNAFDPFSIAENTATALFEDSRGRLWVGLETKGLDLYDSKTSRFRHFTLDFGDNTLFDGRNVLKIQEAADGSIWLIQRGGALVRIPLPADWQKGLPEASDLSGLCPPQRLQVPDYALADSSIRLGYYDLTRLANDEMLLTTSAVQIAFDPKTLAPRRMHETLLHPPLNNVAVHSTDPRQPEGDMWLCVEAKQQGQFLPEKLQNIRKGQSRFFPFAFDQNIESVRMLLGKHGHTLFSVNSSLWDLAPGEIPDFSRPDFNFGHPVNCAFTDRANNLWVGTLGFGLRKISNRQNLFHTAGTGRSLRNIWVSGGRYLTKGYFTIRVLDPKTGILSDESAFPDAPQYQINLVFEPQGGIWLLAARNETQPPQLRHYAPDQLSRADKIIPFEANLNFFDPLLRGRDGRLYLVANNGRLIRFDPSSERFDYFSFAHLFGEKIKLVRAIALAEDADGVFWIGTQEGLVKAVPKNRRSGEQGNGFDFQLIVANPNNPNGLNNNSIACIHPAPDGQIWLGTKGGGINILDARTGRVRHITTANGLLNNVVYGILPGSRTGEFWCSTNRGLAKIVAAPTAGGEALVTTFTAALGLQDNEFNTYSYCRNDNGELLFGGINGLNRFSPDEFRADTVPPPVYVVDIRINHQKSAIACPEHLQTLELAHDQSNLTFEFAALDFTDPAKNRYRYRLVGLDADWVELGNYRFAQFNHLAPGRYELRVEGSKGESAWGAAQPLVLVVHPPWYRSDLAYLCYFLLLTWAGWRVYQFQIQRIKEREQLAFEHRETERVKALEQLKTNFFSNITHEFRTPLTLMIEPLRRVLPKIKDPEVLENVRLAEKNSRQLLGLVNQLLDMAKLESGQMGLDLRRADLRETVRGVFERFLPLAEKRGVKLFMPTLPTDLPTFDFDAGKVELVLNNLISNALEFTPEGGSVVITLGQELPEIFKLSKNLGAPPFIPDGSGQAIPHSSFIILKVSDTGIGIPPEALDKIFDRFYQVDGSHTRAGEGTGIGLALSKELAELMGGQILVESEVGKGSTFAFWLPVTAGGRRQAADGGAGSAAGRATQSHLNTVEQSLARLPTSPPVQRPASAETPVVLVVEDNADLRNFIKKSIGQGWQVVEASDGEEGLRKALDLVPDLVISDMMMPRKDGLTLLGELKTNELTAHIPVVLLTAKSTIESKLKGLQHGADDYLTKPFSVEELLARMENLVETRRRLRERFAQQTAGRALGTAEQLPEFLSAPDQAFLQKINLLIEQHLDDEALSVEDFAAKMLMSRMQLHRKLTALASQSATAYIRNYRLDRAMAMLKNREGNVFQVAGMAGFGNEKYFSTVFKERFGVSPSEV
ncbi:MAG: ATP-binding protein [Saprospiraceae bacterium]